MADNSNSQRLEIEKLVKALISGGGQLGRFKNLMQYDDCRYYALKFISSNIKKTWKKDKAAVILDLIKNLNMSACKDGAKELNKFRFPNSDSALKMSSVAEHKKLYGFIWLEFLRVELDVKIHKDVLTYLPGVLKYFSHPPQLSDYLTEAYNMGGALSLLALNGLFILVTSYNLEYPNFYTKMYALLQPGIFHLSYKARFLYLLDLFLSSTHVSAHLVAAFIKKMSRLTLTAPPESLLCVLPMIRNWLLRHPSCQVLVHRAGSTAEMDSDPYNPNEEEPEKSKAMQSSLWEIKCLAVHHYHKVAEEARKFNNAICQEKDLSDLFEVKIEELIAKERRVIGKEIPFNSPELPQSCIAAELWQLS